MTKSTKRLWGNGSLRLLLMVLSSSTAEMRS